jgi:DUF971 family protein
MNESIFPTGIEVSNNDQVLEIEWSDGLKSSYPLFGLRQNCPCVMCRGGHAHMSEFNPEAFFEKHPSKIDIKDIQQVGNHAIQITWADGHNSGMYRWETLRMLDPANYSKGHKS